MGSFMGISLRLLIHEMSKGGFDLTCLIVGIVVGVLVIVVLTCRLCCDKNGVLTEETTTVQNLQAIQIDVVRTSQEPALHEGNCV